ncbi:thiolase family protein [Brevibacillus nitrificans]|uniref:Thiolase family protein n=1 Tax=Brevibacillus nitrificans TaxID=651560 RepID=A0A3M8DMT3_9BACL|nr:thiolase family protein [Brevibacillus nitrificans]RNB88811.1 thiolase family protein [Brevibacillus nitrificans]
MSLRSKAAITGIGETIFHKNSGTKNILQLASEASVAAIKDAGLSLSDIDGIITLSPLSANSRLNLPLAEFLGIKPTYSDEVSVYGASGAYALKQAAEAITAGTARNILVVGSDLNFLQHRSNESIPLMEDYDVPFGIDANVAYAMAANLHHHLYGTTDEHRAKIAVDQRYNASFYENSLFGKKALTVEDVLQSPVISSPFHLYEIVSPCEGALAFIVSPSEDAKKLTPHPVYIDGAGFYNGHFLISQSQLFHNGVTTPIKKSSEIAFQMAGISTKDVDVCGFYDCYTIAVLLTIEDMGFCKKGEGGRFVLEHDLTFKGDFPVNTSGGQLSVGQPGDAGGMVNAIEVVKQLMGRAGERQIPDAEIGIVNGNGGFFSTECTLVLRRG